MKNRNFGLDLARAIAILLVLLAHGEALIILPQIPYISHTTTQAFGIFGVELFFVLSGFLIGSIIIKSFENHPTRKTVINFWKRRWLRTLPNYYLFFLLSLIVSLFTGSASSQAGAYPFFLQCFTYRNTPMMPESWSLCIEEFFYLLFPIWLVIAPKSKSKYKFFLYSTISFVVVITSLRLYVSLTAEDRPWDFGFRCTTILRLDSIGIGVLGAWLYIYKTKTFLHFKKSLALVGVAIILFSFFAFGYHQTFDQVFFFTLVSFSIILTFPFLIEIETRKNIVTASITHISLISYSLYLIHHSIVLRALAKVDLPNYFEYIIYLSLSIFLSSLNFKYFEVKMTNLRNNMSIPEPELLNSNKSLDTTSISAPR